ncbi:InlB B-repeat-containing protein [Micromonospora sp. LOL_023]|uniref:InlB B-repeat-containing protein n=1 Tax=Micromonospora sp. LOL_023 TaxID=3345418 RepID=UPI003A837DBD
MTRGRQRALAALSGVALALGLIPATGSPAAADTSYPVTVDYQVDAGAMRHIGGGNLHPFDERGPAQWLTDGIDINAIRGTDYSKRTSVYHDYLPGWFEDATRARLQTINPDAKLMIGTYYGFKGKVARGEYGGNTDWKALAQIDEGSAYKEYIAAELADAVAKDIDVYSWVLWNEPDLQWSNQNAFFQGFKNGYDGVKDFDPTQLVQGPELASFKFSYLTAFLTYCKQHDCLPDVLAWHELTRTRTAIEDHARQITEWMRQNDIPVMPIAITEYQGTGYSTTEAGRRSQGNYNPGLSVSYLGELERAAESTSLEFGLRSAWGLPGDNPNSRSFLGEMATFDDDGKMATGIWYVYQAYWEMTGRKVGTTFDKTSVDALATYDDDSTVNESWILLGNWEETAKTIPVTLRNLPPALVASGRVHVQVDLIQETLATPNYGTVPVLRRNVAAAAGQASFSLDLPGRTAARILVTPPAADPTRYSAVPGSGAEPVEVRSTGTVQTSTARLAGTTYAAHTGGTPSSYRDGAGAETAVESGDAVTYRFDVDESAVYRLRTDFVATGSGAFVQPYVDGVSTGTPVDLYSAQPRLVDHEHGTVHLTAGTHEITYRIVGAGKNTASTGYDIGVRSLLVAAPGVPTTDAAIVFDSNDGRGEHARIFASIGASLGALPAPPVRNGYEFVGWNTARTGTGAGVDADTIVAGDMTVWAQWLEIGELAYLVDAGDIDPATVNAGSRLGTHHSVTDQFFGPDPVTGKNWGVLDTARPSATYPNLLTGTYTWPAENLGHTDGTPVGQTYRYAKDQTQPLAQRVGVPYKFELANGRYRVDLAIATGWSAQVDKGYEATVTLNEGTSEAVTALPPTKLSKDWTNPVRASATVKVTNGFLTVNVDMANEASGSVMVNTIEIHRLLAVDVTPPTVTIEPWSESENGSYRQVSFALYDEGTLDKVVVNGVTTDLADAIRTSLDGVEPGRYGAVVGTNTLRAFDLAGNVTEVAFTLAGPPSDWSAPTVYNAGDEITYAGSVWVAQWWTSNEVPGTNPYGAWAESGAVVETSDGTVRAWTPSWIYTGGETVAHGEHLWTARWWTRNQAPGATAGPWLDLGSRQVPS